MRKTTNVEKEFNDNCKYQQRIFEKTMKPYLKSVENVPLLAEKEVTSSNIEYVTDDDQEYYSENEKSIELERSGSETNYNDLEISDVEEENPVKQNGCQPFNQNILNLLNTNVNVGKEKRPQCAMESLQ